MSRSKATRAAAGVRAAGVRTREAAGAEERPGLAADRADRLPVRAHPASPERALKLCAHQGAGDLPYPPDFPKMPGEPSRVQPSRARKRG
ncbi:hypothetical protein [Kitasatospora sp. NPDC057198]|uniref:hypothetical protein n=1 Tax=Kitasatospora sp. NPDC057198 TaxID=3346046 RepID=UPI00364357A6